MTIRNILDEIDGESPPSPNFVELKLASNPPSPEEAEAILVALAQRMLPHLAGLRRQLKDLEKIHS